MSETKKSGFEVFEGLDDKKLMALCLWGEARGEPLSGKIGIAFVIMNRVKKDGWFGSTIKKVILKPKQFSCFNEKDPNRVKLVMLAQNWDYFFQKDKALRECYYVAEKIIEDNTFQDNVFGATHYKTAKCRASWADSMQLVAVIGNHEFYVEKKEETHGN
ncbi:MAG TPA: cell wall hydrolase [Deltaproteobacteria bacterium]|nr:cell wall hydrolase [Deltaproteobacteria bacterium]